MTGSGELQEIKDRLDVVEVLSGYIRLTKAGRNFKALCPFHNEKTPSFVISPDRQIWHCFGCGEGGDIFTFVMKIEGMEFREAMQLLAERAGVEIKKSNFAFDKDINSKKTNILKICHAAKDFYKEKLNKNTQGLKAKKYLLGRGLTEKSISEFEIGYAPDEWHETESTLAAKGFNRNDIFTAGLTVRSEKTKSFYDRFRGRIMFPILDISNNVVGFGGRVFAHEGSEEAKYINTPESPVYNKSKILYGLNIAREAIRKNNGAILVEGYMDVIGSHQMEVKNTVSSSGTALTADQIRIIKRYTSNLILAFDGDDAGQEATRRSIDLALLNGMDIRIITLPEDKDPSDFVDDPSIWKKYAKGAKRIMDFYFENSFKKHNFQTVEGKREIAEEMLGVIRKIPNNIEHAYWLEALSEKLGIDVKFLAEEMKRTEKSDRRSNFESMTNSAPANSRLFSRSRDSWEGQLLALLLVLPNVEKRIQKISDINFSFGNPELDSVYKNISQLKKRGVADDDLVSELKEMLSFESYGKLSEMILEAEYQGEEEKSQANQEKTFNDLLARLMITRYEAKKKRIEADIKIAEKNKDHDARELFLKELGEIAQETEKIKNNL